MKLERQIALHQHEDFKKDKCHFCHPEVRSAGRRPGGSEIRVKIGPEKQYKFHNYQILLDNTKVGYYRFVSNANLSKFDLLFSISPNHHLAVEAIGPTLNGIKVEHLLDDTCPICLRGSEFSEHFYNLPYNHVFHFHVPYRIL